MKSIAAKNKRVVIIGAGFGGLTAAAYLAKAGYSVTVLEKNNWVGGRAQVWRENGFTFDVGPSWYWMPQIFETFFQDFNLSRSHYYQLKRLDPSYRIYFKDEVIDLPASREGMCRLFERYEAGAGKKLEILLKKTASVYDIAMKHFVSYPYMSVFDMLRPSQIVAGLRILAQYNGFISVDQFIKTYVTHPKLVKMLSFPIFFLGESTRHIPSVYSLMNHVDIDQGTWHPMGGFGQVAEAFAAVAKKQGAQIILNQEVIQLTGAKGKLEAALTADQRYPADIIVSNNDYHDTETHLLPQVNQSYNEAYWQRRQLAPSALLMYLGLKEKIPGLLHHTLFFHNNWQNHNQALFGQKKWPEKPLYYVSCPSKTDPSLAPAGKDIVTLLIPLASGLPDSPHHRASLSRTVLADFSAHIHYNLSHAIEWQKLYCLSDFVADYHAFQGNGYGLGQTLLQTAVFRPRCKSRKVSNLFYTGQFTVPGIGVPLVVLSGKLVAQAIQQYYAR